MSQAAPANDLRKIGLQPGLEVGESYSALRVASIIDTASVSGPARQLLAVATGLGRHGVSVAVVCFERSGPRSQAFRRSLEDHAVPHEVVYEKRVLDPSVPSRLRQVLLRLQPHVVQTHGYKPAALAWLLRRTGATWPWVAFFHGETNENAKVRLYNRIHRYAVRGADEVVTMTTRHLGYHRHPYQRVIYNAALEIVSQPDPDFSESVARLALRSPRLLVLGRLSPEKGVDVLLHGLRELPHETVPSLLVVGDGPERGRLEKLALALSIRDRVAFLPSTSDVAAAYASCDAVIIPSWSEGLPNVLLEALAHDRPVLATDVGAVHEVLAGSRAGIIVPPGSPSAIAQAIPGVLALRQDPEAARERRRVVARFSLESRVQAHLSLYRDVLVRHSEDHGAP